VLSNEPKMIIIRCP